MDSDAGAVESLNVSVASGICLYEAVRQRTTDRRAPGSPAGSAARRRIVVLTGAGMSAESGVPTFRDAQTGLWADFGPENWRPSRPSGRGHGVGLVRGRRKMLGVVPNAGHEAIAAFERRPRGG